MKAVIELINKKKEIIESLRTENPNRIPKELNKLAKKLEAEESLINTNIRLLNNILEQFLFNRWESKFGDWEYNQIICNKGPQLETEFRVKNTNKDYYSSIDKQPKATFNISGDNLTYREFLNMTKEQKIDCIYQLIYAYLRDPYFCINIEKEFSPFIYKDLINLNAI